MSVVQFPDAIDSSADLQIWNNAAFDNGEISADLGQSWGSLKSLFGNPKASLDSVTGKENQGPVVENQIPSVASSLKSSSVNPKENQVLKEIRDEKKIDEEIEAIESEIIRLKSRLDDLRLEKAERGIKVIEKRGRVVAAKFMGQKQSIKNGEDKKNIEEIPNLSERNRVNRRGMSMGPTEIIGAVKSSKQEMITPFQSRRKSCFWKLQGIEEEREDKSEKVKSSIISPKSRKAVTTIASRKTLKKEEVITNLLQPKKLFSKDGEKAVLPSNKKASRQGRVVPSRYNQGTTQAAAMGKSVGSEGRVKKKWEIPSEIVVHGSVEGEKSPLPIVAVPDVLPRLRIVRAVKESPRDSGPALRVVELIGRKPFFGREEDGEESVCQALSYTEEEGEES